jgi:Rod binding domain-containing protein
MTRITFPPLTNIPAQPGADRSAKVDPSREKEIEKSAQQFEGLLLETMLKSMWSTVPKSELFASSGNEDEMYQGMLNEALASTISGGRGIGVKNVLINDMKRLERRTESQELSDSPGQKDHLKVDQTG